MALIVILILTSPIILGILIGSMLPKRETNEQEQIKMMMWTQEDHKINKPKFNIFRKDDHML